MTPTREARALHEGIAGSSLAVIRAAGHVSAFERPEAVADELRQFLRALPLQAGEATP